MNRMRKMNNKGFTLVEIMLSIAILALISVPLMNYFSDSLKYAVQTEEKQKATLLAQETIEMIKAQKKIVKEVVAASAAPKTYDMNENLLSMFGGPATTPSVVSSNFYTEGATGEDGAPEPLIYRYVDQGSNKYYVETSFVCTTKAALVSSPAILGIDDSRNVVIAERNEEADAMTYFTSMNLHHYLAASGAVVVGSATPSASPSGFEYITPDPGPTSTPGPDPRILTEDELKANMKRIIYITVKRHSGDSYFNVTAHYKYFCSDTYGDGSAEGKLERTSPDLVETNVENLEGIYIMFNKFNPARDDIQLFWDVEDTSIEYPDFRFIVQDDVEPAPTGTPVPGATPTVTPVATATPTTTPVATSTPDPLVVYNLKISFLNFDDGTKPFDIHSNMTEGFQFVNISSELTEPDDPLAGEGARAGITVKPLTGGGMPVRIFNIEVKVYKDEDAFTAGKDPLISLKTSKVE